MTNTPGGTPFVHDPCITREGGDYYVFSTGSGIPIRHSSDLVHWQQAGRVFPDDAPAWAKEAVPGSRGVWAPDIAFVNGRFRLYYSVSTFGSNRSVIGLATNTTLDSKRADYQWVDEGLVSESRQTNDFNAIDPNFLSVPPRHFLCFGSFWSGIKMLPLDPGTGRPTAGEPMIALAQRATPDALEAPFLIRRGPYFYLFVSFDYCCRGVNSSYNIRVGRAREVTGIYYDHTGRAMLAGGGSRLLESEGDAIGPGGCSVLQRAEGDLLVYHIYDGSRAGAATLRIRPLHWSAEGWPVAGLPLPLVEAP